MSTGRDRSKALKHLRHMLLYLNGREGHEVVRTIYIAIRGPYDFRRVGHVTDLPIKRDWLDPDVERAAKQLLKDLEG